MSTFENRAFTGLIAAAIFLAGMLVGVVSLAPRPPVVAERPVAGRFERAVALAEPPVPMSDDERAEVMRRALKSMGPTKAMVERQEAEWARLGLPRP